MLTMGRWRFVIGLVLGAYVLWGVVACVMTTAGRPLTTVVVLVLYSAGVGCAYLGWRRARAADWLAAAVVIGLVAHAYLSYTGLTALFFAVFAAPLRLPLWRAVTLTAVVIAGFVSVSLLTGLPAGPIWGVAAGLGWTMMFGAMLNQLSVTRQQAAELAASRVLDERQRLAREIHDVLAHALAAQAVHLEGTRMLLAADGDRGAALDRVTQAVAMARAGLEETKRAVAALRGESRPLAAELDALATQFRRSTGNPCAVEISGEPDALAMETRLAVVRTTQEALTNVHKHAPHASVTVALRCADGRCELDVHDTGGAPGALAGAGSGYGLVGMRERAELIGGSLSAQPHGDGFRVLLRVPA